MSSLRFELAPALWAGLPVALALLLLQGRALSRAGFRPLAIAALLALRGAVLAVLVILAARPVLEQRDVAAARQRSVLLLLDRSDSMALPGGSASRWDEARALAVTQLVPALRAAGLAVRPFLFAGDAQSVAPEGLALAATGGRRTDLAGALAQALATSETPPLAVVALTDGAANESRQNARALTALHDAGAPFIGVGFGRDQGAPLLSLRRVEAPPIVAPGSPFEVTAHLVSAGVDSTAAFELLLLRDGALHQRRSAALAEGSRLFLESFRVTEAEEGVHHYEVRLVPPPSSRLVSASTSGRAAVRIAKEKELRILYAQGALTWDYKFIGMALRGDPAVKLTGLTRTSSESLFRQNVEGAGELVGGFPRTLDEIAPFRVVILESLRPKDLTPEQQELLARYCGELGGGILMIGGSATFDGSWQGSRLEQLLPVSLAADGARGVERAFRFEPTDEALAHPVFQISDSGAAREAWRSLPTFLEYGRVDAAKPGAQVWATHPDDEGPDGKRVLMAVQRYGSGVSAALTVEGFWRWRLAKESDPRAFDRFWQQLLRHLAEANRQEVSIHLADAELHPGMDVHLTLERAAGPQDAAGSRASYRVRVEDEKHSAVADEAVDLRPGRAAGVVFPAAAAGLYTVTVADAHKVRVGTRTIEVEDMNLEHVATERNMELLRQWAAVSDGLALRAEDCASGAELVREIRTKAEPARRRKPSRRPLGVNGAVLAGLLAALAGEWVLRKRWGLS